MKKETSLIFRLVANWLKIISFFDNLGYGQNRAQGSQRAHGLYVTHVTHVPNKSYGLKNNSHLEFSKIVFFYPCLCARPSTTLLVEREKLSDLNEVFV